MNTQDVIEKLKSHRADLSELSTKKLSPLGQRLKNGEIPIDGIRTDDDNVEYFYIMNDLIHETIGGGVARQLEYTKRLISKVENASADKKWEVLSNSIFDILIGSEGAIEDARARLMTVKKRHPQSAEAIDAWYQRDMEPLIERAEILQEQARALVETVRGARE